jgi:ABC-type transport system involved in multi-copper enzyme maturation permease subunit
MNVLPVIARELRVQARQSFTYLLRVLGVILLLLACLPLVVRYNSSDAIGGLLFASMNFTLFCTIWILVPSLAADCISREKREGTLGLLFLTPLKARDIVLAKGLVHGLRAFTLWLAVLPAMTIPFLMGGANWQEAVTSALVSFSSICWALSAGILASATGKMWSRCLILAYGLGGLLFVGFGLVNGMVLEVMLGSYFPSPRFQAFTTNSIETFYLGVAEAGGSGGMWGQMLSLLPPAGQRAWLFSHVLMGFISVFVLVLAIRMAAWPLRHGWQDRQASRRQLWLEKVFCTPVLWVAFLRGWMRRKLERNPIGWLEQRSWSGRIVMWGWFAMMISLYSVALTDGFPRSIHFLQEFMAWMLIVGISVSAAGSFRRERETGVLELLLVSPITESQLIGGRLRGLWGQFMPAMVLLLVIWGYFDTIIGPRYEPVPAWFFAIAFLTMPVIGLYYSLRKSSFFSAFLFTVLIGTLLPFGLKGLMLYLFEYVYDGSRLTGGALEWLLGLMGSNAFITFWQLAMAGILGRRLYHDLARRNFSFEKALT